jgi:hypothetical protein
MELNKSKKIGKRKLNAVSKSTDAETVLTILINHQNEEDFTKFLRSRNASARFLVKYFKTYNISGNMEDVYGNIVSQIKKLSIEPNAVRLGSSNFSTTQVWQEYGGSKRLKAKTDVYAGFGYSIKNGSTRVRILDAAVPQLKALCMSTINDPEVAVPSNVKRRVMKALNNIIKIAQEEGASMSRYVAGTHEKFDIGELRKSTIKSVKAMVERYDENTRALNSEVNKIFNSLSNHDNFMYKFIYESITGEKAFGNSQASMQYILVWKDDFSEVHKLSVDEVIHNIISKFRVPQFVPKTSGNRIKKTIQMYFKTHNNGRISPLV